MAMGCPIVTTSIGCEGIDLVDDEEVFIRDSNNKFADAVVQLLDDAEKRKNFSKKCREKIIKNYTWDTIVNKFNKFLGAIVNSQKCVCGSSDYKEIFRGLYTGMQIKNYFFKILECKACGIARTYPAPSITLAKKNVDYSFTKDMDKYEKSNIWAKGVLQAAMKYVKEGNLLELGCFTGKLLEEAQKFGFKAYGVDFYKPAVEFGRSKGRNIHFGEIYDAAFKDSFFSCIILNHVFEHLKDPIRCVKQLNRILKYNGILAINIPTHKALMRHIMGQHWMSWCPHIHRFFYTKKALEDIIVKNSQLKPIYIHQKGRLEPVTIGWFRNKAKDIIAGFASLINKGEQIEAIFIKK